MNINTRSRVIAYLSICLFFFSAGKRIVNQYEDDKDRTIMNEEITDLDLDRLDISKGTYYFLLYDPMWGPIGICYDKDGKLPQENFGRDVEYVKLNNNWY